MHQKANRHTKAGRYVVLLASLVVTIAIAGPWDAFKATALSGATVSSEKLIGQPTILIITPSKAASESTRTWVEALRDELDASDYRVRDVIAISLPFFLSEEDAVSKARDSVPERFHDQTWLLDSTALEASLGIPRDSDKAAIVVLDVDGKVVARVHGALNDQRLKTVVNAAEAL